MDLDFPLEDTEGSPLDLEKAFGCPDSLRTARVLVRIMMHMEPERRPAPAMQQSIAKSFTVTRPMSRSGMSVSNPTMPKTVQQALTLSDSQSPTLSEVNSRAAHLSSDNSNGRERVEYCTAPIVIRVDLACHNTNTNIVLAAHIKLGSSNSASGNLYFANNNSPSHFYQTPAKQTHLQSDSFNHTSQRFPPVLDKSLAVSLDHQSERNSGGWPRQSEISSYSTPSVNALQQPPSRLELLSNLASIDREYLNIGTMDTTKKPSPHTSSSHPPKSNNRPQTTALAPQPRKLIPHSMPRPLMPLPTLASKPHPDDREMLQVVESQRKSPFSDGTGARSSSTSTIDTIQLKKKVPRKRKVTADCEGEVVKKAKKAKGEPKGDRRDLVCICSRSQVATANKPLD
jgi:hypothetical protein